MVAASGRRRASTSDRASDGHEAHDEQGQAAHSSRGEAVLPGRDVGHGDGGGRILGDLLLDDRHRLHHLEAHAGDPMTRHAHEGHKNQCGHRCPPASETRAVGKRAKGSTRDPRMAKL